MARLCSLLAAAAAVTATAVEVKLVTFDGAEGTTFTFKELNDPVMGGRSTGTWNVDQQGHFGVFDGEVVDVPSLKAPGFIKAAADGSFADASAAAGGDLVLEVRSPTAEYQGFRVSFVSGSLAPSYACAGGGSIPLSRGCFKAHFNVPAGSDFVKVHVPLSSFTDRWSPATGEPTATCQQDASACATAKKLAGIKRVEVWAEGKNGKIHLEVRSISVVSPAVDVPRVAARPPKDFDSCSGAVQPNLRYNISGRMQPTVPVAVGADESLAEAVCCDKRVAAFAEPQFLFQAPDIQLFTRMSEGVTTFYDSVCGVPLFRAPVNRSRADFEADTNEHGWPSFRAEEVVQEHVRIDKMTGYVTSSCGTHLGSYLPDSKGPRWCMDLSCIAGNPASDVASKPEASLIVVA